MEGNLGHLTNKVRISKRLLKRKHEIHLTHWMRGANKFDSYVNMNEPIQFDESEIR